ncbi:MAG TPA: signal recognition particle-docking protein FtsY [Bacilli bacterium]|nr:signal recognition particle-docking protein FtsY [Bacilli bacterium]
MGIFSKIKNVFVKPEYEKGLSKTREDFVNKLSKLSKQYSEVNDNYINDLEEILINADIGISAVMKFMDKLQDRISKEKITSPSILNEIIVDELFIAYVDNDIITNKININENGPTVILFIGVNGVGKTTTIVKFAHKFKDKKVLMVAADTFRAGAIEQLHELGKKINCDVFSNVNTSDPASVIYQALEKAVDEKYDYVLIDTAGRLQNKVNLMNELSKINKVCEKIIDKAPHETLLIIDATTGQNGIDQAKKFMEITNITGIILTKLDGTAKGGIVIAIKEETKIPVKYIGVGEKVNDLYPFDIEEYIYGLFKEMF